ncbi:hypothetical protein [Leptospira weilii]|uniref:hypothetical protein n=1 Tax=Leptospira weilii TaxID=28184 RepID=UPI000A93E15C|nr:hypothetical protein [Leptospira weilii]
MFEYRLRIPLKQENGSPWSDPRLRLDDERVDESYELIEGATYTFWGRVVGPTFFPILQFKYRIFPYFFLGIRSQLYRWEVTIPK